MREIMSYQDKYRYRYLDNLFILGVNATDKQ